MSDPKSKAPVLYCVPMSDRETEGLKEVLAIQCAYPLGVVSHSQEMLDTLRLELAAGHPLIADFEALVRVAKQAHTQADVLYQVLMRGTFVRQPDGGRHD